MRWVDNTGKVYIEKENTWRMYPAPEYIFAIGDFPGAHSGGYLLKRDEVRPEFNQYLLEVEQCFEIADTTILPIKPL
jgi:hypothetical protein